MSPEKLKNYYTVITDCWALLKKFSEPVDSDEFWKSMTEEANEIYLKHGRAPFSEKLVSTVMDEIENIWSNQK